MRRATPILKQRLASKKLALGAPVFIRIFKESRKLEVWLQDPTEKKFKHFKTWKIAAMSGQLGPKTKEGDRQAPEGFYFVPRSRMKPDSRFHLAFNLGYPNPYDRVHRRTGNFLMVHGNRVSLGCFAMTDPGIEEIYTLCASALRNGQPFFRVHSFPFRMTPERMEQAKASPHFAFWENLKQGYDWFETHGTPPDVQVRNNVYQFSAASE
ncbi:murein L,D-transpeptidase [Verrucomicrobiaceae bacterium N1E253]|uniref:Murein L,D-transpeptidase n=1 Tax=Oceaniferula marina TaxID=2748318 RepID=A0A851GPG4_9BACT|nr:murein L,D-transpeptidase [Oceaniferula marina]